VADGLPRVSIGADGLRLLGGNEIHVPADERTPLWSQRLTEHRIRRDYSYAEVAHRLRTLLRQQDGSDCGVTARTVWRWEHGTRPLARYRRLLCALYGVSSEELGFRLSAHTPSATPEAVRTATQAVLQAFRHADRQLGGGYIYGAVISYLTREVAPKLAASTPDAYAAAAALTEMAGWMAHDAGHDGLAQRHFDRALRLACSTDDVELTAHIHGSVSHLAQHAERPHQALRVAEAGVAILRCKERGPAVAARLHAMEARAFAALGRKADCGRTLLSAERMLDRRPLDTPSPWTSPFDHASLAAEASHCMQQLRQLPAARRHSERVIGLRNSTHARSRAFSQLRLAHILVTQGEIDHACTIAADALESSGQLSSHRVSQLLHALYSRLLPHAAARGVDDVVEALSAALGARVPAHLLVDPRQDREP
jgi:transcriptional regulator with XRE-family HTH domain